MAQRRIPIATYRLQFNRALRFEDARLLVPYLHDLGISDIYASPVLQARSGSDHGYDVVHPLRLNPELGTQEEFRALGEALRRRDMGLLLDIVPNHMCACDENEWWMDVLRHGRASRYAPVFDIHWNEAAGSRTGRDRVGLPVLADPYGCALEAQEIRLALAEDGFVVIHHGHRFPVDPVTTAPILVQRLPRLRERLGEHHPALQTLDELLRAMDQIRQDTAAAEDPPRGERAEWIRATLARLLEDVPEVRRHVEGNVRILNGTPGDPESFAALDDLLRRQHYRLAWWRLAPEVLNYRRFFDVNELVGIRAEDPWVFGLTHRLILEMIREGPVTGLRIDHIDGLRDPLDYLARLQEAIGETHRDRGFYVVVEKILTGGERLPREWPVDGTTGYDFLDALNGIFVDPEGLDALDRTYARHIGRTTRFRDLLHEQKTRVLVELFGTDLRRLADRLVRLASRDRHGRDIPRQNLRDALAQATACLPVYRTYIRDARPPAGDRALVTKALEEAGRRGPDESRKAREFLQRVLLGPASPGTAEDERLEFVRSWQQLSGPVTAKGLEDTALYQYNRLLALNYVGSDPDPEPSTLRVEAFHDHNQRILRDWPHTLRSTSTHDSKRSEEVRARLYTLSEMAPAWEGALQRWSRLNRRHRAVRKGRLVPGPNQEILFYQTLLGAWPLQGGADRPFRDRIKRYLIKAAREARVRTSWQDPDEIHENALREFVDAVLEESVNHTFLKDFRAFQARVAYLGALNALSQVVLKIASPGVPDFYQGTEIWNLRLVDPDNRGPVDFARRQDMLARLRDAERSGRSDLVRELLDSWADGRVKMYVMSRALRLRREERALFEEGAYLPIVADGPRARYVCAFARRLGEAWAICAVPIRLARYTSPGFPPVGERVWKGTSLRLPRGAPTRWQDAFSGGAVLARESRRLPASAVFQSLTVGLLVYTEARGRRSEGIRDEDVLRPGSKGRAQLRTDSRTGDPRRGRARVRGHLHARSERGAPGAHGPQFRAQGPDGGPDPAAGGAGAGR